MARPSSEFSARCTRSDRAGVEPGRLATGDPLDLRTQVVDVFIKGRQVPDDDRHNRLYLKYKARPLPVVTP